MPRPLIRLTTVPMLLALCLLLPTLVACQTNPATGRSYIPVYGRDASIEVGRSVAPELVHGYGGAITDSTITTYVRNVGMSMAQHTEGDYSTLPWEFTVLNSDVINAFALPGGQVFISRALLKLMTTEAQMAGVLGHEIGHVTAEHINERISRQLGLQLGITLASVLASQSGSELARTITPMVSDSAGLFVLRFDRNQELESDRLGMRYMTRAGYNPRAQLEVMQILGSASEGQARPPEFMSTHPHAETRIRAIEQLLATEYADTQNNPEYQEFPERFRAMMLDRLRTLPPAPSAARDGRTLLLPAIAQAQDMPPELALLINAQWCGLCRAQLTALQAGVR